MPLFNPVTPAEIGGLAAANNLSDVASESTSLANLGGMPRLTRVLFTVPSPGATHTALANEITAVDTTSGSGTVYLPDAPAAGTLNAVKQIILGGSNTVTVQCQGSDVINKTGGGTTQSLTLTSQGSQLHYSGAGIWTVLSDDLPLAQLELLFAQLTSPALLGTPTAPTATPLTASTQLATTAYADSAVGVEKSRAQTAEALKAPLASPALTGTPTVNGQAIPNYAGIFGTGSDGAVTLDGTTAYTGFSSLAGSTYTLTRDVQASSLTVSNGVTPKTANFRIFCTGTITNNGTISNNGNNASGSSGGATSSGNTLGGGRSGGAGGTGVSGAGASGTAAAFGAAAGAGGAGTSGAGGAGIASSSGIAGAALQNNLLLSPYPVLMGAAMYSASVFPLQVGCGGGGGGSDVATNAGGGGGGGGSIVALLAAAVVNNGTISAVGGNGANGTAGNAGGGGSGSGGVIAAYTLTAWTAGTTSVAAGTPGNGSGTGSNGNSGGAGLVLNSVL